MTRFNIQFYSNLYQNKRINNSFCREEPEETRKRNDKKEAAQVSQPLDRSQLSQDEQNYLDCKLENARIIEETPKASKRTEEQRQQLQKNKDRMKKLAKRIDVSKLTTRKAAMSSTERSQIWRKGKSDLEKQREREAAAEGMKKMRKHQRKSS